MKFQKGAENETFNTKSQRPKRMAAITGTMPRQLMQQV